MGRENVLEFFPDEPFEREKKKKGTKKKRRKIFGLREETEWLMRGSSHVFPLHLLSPSLSGPQKSPGK